MVPFRKLFQLLEQAVLARAGPRSARIDEGGDENGFTETIGNIAVNPATK